MFLPTRLGPWFISVIAVAVFALASTVSGVDYATCMKQADTVCNRTHAHPSTMIFCTSDGHKYHMCDYLKAHCKANITLLATGAHCEHKIQHYHPITRPPPTAFEKDLFQTIRTGIDSLLSKSRNKGISPAKAMPIFSTQDHTHKIYKRNPDCWAYDLDLTPLSPWNSELHNRKAGTLISPRHAVWARHYTVHVNSTVRFVDRHNHVYDRRVVKIRYVDHHPKPHVKESFYGRDIVVGLLDSDLPSSISFAKVMPESLTTFTAPRESDQRLPVLSTDQEEKAIVTDFYRYSGTSASLTTPLNTSIRHDYYERKIGGDSGNPTFFVIDRQLVLLFLFTTGGAGGGTNLNHHYVEINRLMKEMGGSYQLTPVNLTRFLHHQALPHIVG